MGVVYEAEQVSLGRHVALKVLPPQMVRDAKQRRRFEREARAAARLHHTNIVPVFGVGEHEGTPYYVMQFIAGPGPRRGARGAEAAAAGKAVTARAARRHAKIGVAAATSTAADMARSLLTGRFDRGRRSTAGRRADATAGPSRDARRPTSHAVRRGRHPSGPHLADAFVVVVLLGRPARHGQRRVDRSAVQAATYWQSVAQIGVQVADALEYAHKQGSSTATSSRRTCCWTPAAPSGSTDFGLAKADDQQNLTHTGDILGTLRYMPPEAFEGKPTPGRRLLAGPDPLRAAGPAAGLRREGPRPADQAGDDRGARRG